MNVKIPNLIINLEIEEKARIFLKETNKVRLRIEFKSRRVTDDLRLCEKVIYRMAGHFPYGEEFDFDHVYVDVVDESPIDLKKSYISVIGGDIISAESDRDTGLYVVGHVSQKINYPVDRIELTLPLQIHED